MPKGTTLRITSHSVIHRRTSINLQNFVPFTNGHSLTARNSSFFARSSRPHRISNSRYTLQSTELPRHLCQRKELSAKTTHHQAEQSAYRSSSTAADSPFRVLSSSASQRLLSHEATQTSATLLGTSFAAAPAPSPLRNSALSRPQTPCPFSPSRNTPRINVLLG